MAYSGRVFVFTKRSPDDKLFKYLVPHSNLIRNEIINLLTPKLKVKYTALNTPEIAIHIRRGDFKIANPITSNEFFITTIQLIREAEGRELPVTIFTDAKKMKLKIF